jgi:hypothetical protein
MSRRCPPDWTLTGVEVQWPDGPQTVLAPSAWRPTESGWTCSVGLRRRSLPRHTRVVPLDVHLTDEALAGEAESPDLWIRARDLVTERVRNSVANDMLDAHLGEVVIR